MRAVILGGTFSPVHVGHLYLAEEVKLSFGYDKVIFVPTSIPAHKRIEEDISPLQRMRMLEIALASYSDALIDACEIERGGISYSLDTIKHLKEKYKIAGKPGLIIGDDLLEGFSTWKNASLVSQKAKLIVVHRRYEGEQEFPYPHVYADNLMISVSSSAIRKRLREGRSVRFLVPEEVLTYIEENGLYRRFI